MNGKMVLIARVVCTFISTGVALGYSNGTGTSDFPFEISSPAELVALGQTPDDYGKHFILTADIDLAGYTFDQAVIAPDMDTAWGFQGAIFGGVFDGNGHVISHLTLLVPDEKEFIGLFGFSSGQIKNLGIQDAMVQGGWFVGGLVGFQRSGAIASCWVSGSVSGTGNYIGGVVGYFEWWGTIRDSHATCTVNGGNSVGGLVGFDGGWYKEVTIIRCYATGDVSGTGGSVGGLVGDDASMLTSCYATGNVRGAYGVGGLCGSHERGHYGDGFIGDSYATGSVDGTGDQVGGLVGSHSGTIRQSFASGSVTSDGDLVGGLTGQNGGTILACYATGTVRGGSKVGGLAGKNGGLISASYAMGSISGYSNVGGLIGLNGGIISSCYSIGRASGYSAVGGMVGINQNQGTITSCFWDTQRSGNATSAGGTGKNTSEMKTLATFTLAGWDFIGETTNGTEDLWTIRDGTNYPSLVWQTTQTDWVGPNGVGLEDLLYLSERWMAATPEAVGAADANGDGKVDMADFAILASNWM